MKLAGLLLFSSDIHSLGLKATEGLMFTDSWHWDLNPESRKFSDRFKCSRRCPPRCRQPTTRPPCSI
jgi:hypothetical protein